MTVSTPTRAELVARAEGLVPLLRENAAEVESRRRLTDDVVDALDGAGLLGLRRPARYGGHEADTRTVTDVVTQLTRGDGSTGWTAAVWSISAWMMARFPDKVRDEVFSSPDTRVCGIIGPTAVATPADGGVVVNGRWSFNTGVQQSHWNTNAAVRPLPDGGYEPVMLAIPVDDLEIVDDWDTAGLRGSGSVSTTAENLFVPQERVLSIVPVIQGQPSYEGEDTAPAYAVPFMPTACATISGVALGLALAARDLFFERLPGRKITYTSYDDQAQAPVTHLTVAKAEAAIEEADFHTRRAAEIADLGGPQGWTIEDRSKVRLHMGAACRRAREAVTLLADASGASSVYSSVPIQRVERDMRTLSLHAIMHPETNFELHGRTMCGLAPNTDYV
ncbi:acyl-CoA dehydrogenase family protein [Nocardiopsis sp. FIRDI 009]|uniref:acyl-CoA dehydrogenase family protein n=1 Tax=Nocardiopsis sp. FIRDI 009 TaxID=714197 RepID=UPI001E598BD2|nr:acyl-CoA dehydrogenase family protein [Nocardiopsis sp. FIRDI 009]